MRPYICNTSWRVSASGLSKISYAAAAVIRGFNQGSGSRLFQPVVTVRDTGSVGHRGDGGGEGRDGMWMGEKVAQDTGEGPGVNGFLSSLQMKAVSSSGLSNISYAVAAVGRGFNRGSGSRLFQPRVWDIGVMGDGCDVMGCG